jgi:hypothetical protein
MSRQGPHAVAQQEGCDASASIHRNVKLYSIASTRKPEHNGKWSSEQEFMTLLKKLGVEYDPQFAIG